ncbi:hypothetical protein BRADI_1g04490v3 [Brachypodium distachyon]|uniref:DUF4283 domain-containing protein n=1 Tax=Brachypodium distachyon TaxID=15368 RepID=A0A0Q3GNA7_BRADI|nr:hypothetical protein BRADI_1g04490v3 [Brachypodium distachyon]
MQPAAAIALMPEGATALEIPSATDRPHFATRPSFDGPPPATSVYLDIPTSVYQAQKFRLYMDPDLLTPDPELEYQARRLAYAYITPAEAPCRADPGPFVRRVFRTLALDLPQTFELLKPSSFGDITVRFRTPEDREAAMRRQPFVLDGATVKLVREGETPNIRRASNDYVVHVLLRGYPIEQRMEKKIKDNCCRFGLVREIHPDCFAAPDLATVHLEHPTEIPNVLLIEYRDGSTSIVPVEIVRVWHRSHSYDADAQYVRIFPAPAPAA